MNEQIIFSLITAVSISAAAAYLGSLMLSKKMVLAAGPLGHLSLPGIALALIYGWNISLMAFPFVVLGIFLIWLFEVRTKLSTEALTAIVFSAGVAFAFLFLPIEQAETALVGDISSVSLIDMLTALFISFLVFLIIFKIYSKMVLINISEDLAKAEGVRVGMYNFFYLFCLALMVALGVKLVGGLLTAALVAIPASAARNISRKMFDYVFWAVLVGVVSAIVGFFLFKITALPAGPLIILTSAFFFLLSVIFKK